MTAAPCTALALVAPPLTADELEYLRRVCLKVLKPGHPDVDDAVQDAALNVIRFGAAFRGDSKRTTWLYRIALTTCLMRLRSARRRAIRAVDDNDAQLAALPSPAPSPEAAAQAGELVGEVDRALASLTSRYADVLDLKLGGRSYAETAQLTGENVQTVKTRVHRGLTNDALRRRLMTKFGYGERAAKARAWIKDHPDGTRAEFTRATGITMASASFATAVGRGGRGKRNPAARDVRAAPTKPAAVPPPGPTPPRVDPPRVDPPAQPQFPPRFAPLVAAEPAGDALAHAQEANDGLRAEVAYLRWCLTGEREGYTGRLLNELGARPTKP